ncbi:MAG TPA: hypothetical protein DCQ06_05430 [Myxococcales bacterium]|nr:hypothetical protein [Myxococcales bacterium]HAN31020.1 hypothetical protein [Myxococcales bacterium]
MTGVQSSKRKLGSSWIDLVARHLLIPVAKRTLQPSVQWYLRRTRTYRGFGLQLQIAPGVFHPRWFFSSQVMAQWLTEQALQDKSLLDFGTGSGLLGLVAASRGARVTLLDVSARALMCAHDNAMANGLSVHLIHSDGFCQVDDRGGWDVIVSNPPWFPHQPDSQASFAWNAGSELQWFDHFFDALPEHLNDGGSCFFVMAQSADLVSIDELAGRYGWILKSIHQERVWWEQQMIIEVCRPDRGNTL